MNREELLAAMQGTTAKPIAVDVPKWGTVYVRSRTLEEVDADAENESKAQEQDKADNKHRRLARAVMNVICDEQGNRVFTADDLDLIAAQPYFILQKVLAAAGGQQEEEDEGKSEGATS
jgi:hypothetical protein